MHRPDIALTEDSTMTTINRRELLQRVAYLMGGAISAPAMLGILQGCKPSPASGGKALFLTEPQAAIVAEIAEIMIPRTDTPGAKDLGVPAFIDLMLKDAYQDEDRARFVMGLTEFQALARREHQKDFMALEQEKRVSLVQGVHDAAVAEARGLPPATALQRRPFILMTKELTLLWYFSSETGATKVLQYDAVPGAFHGCVPLSGAGNGHTWAGETSLRF
jgi:gluconate 2-dehydrogenase gamma chain